MGRFNSALVQSVKKTLKIFAITLGSLLMIYLFIWGFIVGIYCKRFIGHGGALGRDSFSPIIVYSLYPDYKIRPLLIMHGWCASKIHPDSRRMMYVIIEYFYMRDNI